MTTPYAPAAGLNPFATKLPPTVSPIAPLFGIGEPEGVVSANPGTHYTDTSTSLTYIKVSGVSNQGWKATGGTAGTNSGDGSSGGVGIPFKTVSGRDAWTPSSPYAACLLIDSVPPFQLSIWADGEWH